MRRPCVTARRRVIVRKLQRQAARAAIKRSTRDAAAPQPMRLDDEWRRWAAENLLLGAPAEPIAQQLVQTGAPPQPVAAEIQAATASPYFRAGRIVAARLAHRGWVLESP